MKILQITDALPPAVLGGSGRMVWEIATGLQRKGHTVSTLTCSEAGVMPAEKDGVTIYTIPPKGRRWMHYRSVFSKKRAQEVLAHIESIQPDIIHAHLLAGQCGYKWIPEARKRGIPVIITCHDVMNFACARILPSTKIIWLRDLLSFKWSWNPLRTSIIRSIFNKYCTVLTVSDALRKPMEAAGFTNLQTVHNAIDLNFWKEAGSKQEARTTLGLPQDKTLFFLAGRLGADKGIEPVAKSLPTDAHLVIAGDWDGPAFDPIIDRVHAFHHQSAEQMRLLYTACDTTLVPSLCLDCFPTVCLESMAVSRPVIATNLGGAKESVMNTITGWILDPRDTRAFRSRMQWCMEHPEELLTIGQNGRSHMERAFSQEQFLETLLGIYKTQKGTL